MVYDIPSLSVKLLLDLETRKDFYLLCNSLYHQLLDLLADRDLLFESEINFPLILELLPVIQVKICSYYFLFFYFRLPIFYRLLMILQLFFLTLLLSFFHHPPSDTIFIYLF